MEFIVHRWKTSPSAQGSAEEKARKRGNSSEYLSVSLFSLVSFDIVVLNMLSLL